MQLRIVKALTFIALPILYSVMFFHSTRFAGDVGAPPWWIGHFPSTFSGAFTWFSILRAIAIAIVALPIGFVCGRAFRNRPLISAATIGAMAFLLGRADLLFNSYSVDPWIKVTLVLDLAILVAVPVAIAKLLHSNPSLERP